MKFEKGDRVHMYNWRTAIGIMKALGELCDDHVYGIDKHSWDKWRTADDLIVTEARLNAPDGGVSDERYEIRSESLDGPNGFCWVIPGVCLYKK